MATSIVFDLGCALFVGDHNWLVLRRFSLRVRSSFVELCTNVERVLYWRVVPPYLAFGNLGSVVEGLYDSRDRPGFQHDFTIWESDGQWEDGLLYVDFRRTFN